MSSLMKFIFTEIHILEKKITAFQKTISLIMYEKQEFFKEKLKNEKYC